jgi:hypothetical protein
MAARFLLHFQLHFSGILSSILSCKTRPARNRIGLSGDELRSTHVPDRHGRSAGAAFMVNLAKSR